MTLFCVRFVSDKKDCSNGFHIEYKPILNSCLLKSDPSKYEKLSDSGSSLYPVQMLASSSGVTPCEERHSEMEFDIKSANFPNNYSNNLDCVYFVVRGSEQVCGLELRYIKFSLEESEGCAYDFLEVDGESFCGDLPNGSRNVFRFTKSVKTISFQTDGQMNAQGFHITVRQLTDCENTFMPTEDASLSPTELRTQMCNIVVKEGHGQLVSPNYPQPYPEDLLCVYTVEKHSNNCLLELTFDQFDLQDSDNCEADFFELENKKFCAKMLHKTKQTVPFNEEKYVKFLFRTDDNKSSQGFVLNYRQLACGSQRDSSGHNDTLEGQEVENPQFTTVPRVNTNQDNGSKPNSSYYYQKPCFSLFDKKQFTLLSETNNGSYKENLGKSSVHFSIHFENACVKHGNVELYFPIITYAIFTVQVSFFI